MNKNIVFGRTKMLVGACQRATARAVGNKVLAEAGQRRYFAGRELIAAGEAQQIIKRCITRLQAH